ncbi:matrixin family metalloprotease [Rheinheimera baltica]|uniref:Matrixin family metalloprotease n=1 Tax=Rheinheimera baltica TaxID=67576 RepID=A0ABT9HVU1_9GAMM|nr:matrixin family metalloprotease [Rheinheimera baltica]MDP5135108.1 matrixin family metalloprotease [Rheinheimera baltica]
MRFLLRALFYTLLLYVSYLLLTGLIRKDAPLPQVLERYAEATVKQYLCTLPISWRIGELDPAFALTLEQAEHAALLAAAQWNNAFGIEVFRYDSIDGFPINFAYDERQQHLLQQALLQRNLQRYDSNINQRLENLQHQHARLQQQQTQFARDNQQFAADIAAFERKAQYASAANRSALQREQQQLNARQQQLQQKAEELNAKQQQLVREQDYVNDTVADRNALLSQQPATDVAAEVGLMEIRGKQRTMTIFAYKTLVDLQLTMAHEFGHALGVGHTDSPASVMHFALNTQQSELTVDDIQAVSHQCDLQPQ